MEFDRSRVYSAVNADELKPGDKVIVADTLDLLKRCVKDSNPISTIRTIEPEDFMFRFAIENNTATFALAYLVERAKNCYSCVHRESAGCKPNVSPINCCPCYDREIKQSYIEPKTENRCATCAKSKNGGRGTCVLEEGYGCDDYELKAKKRYRPFKDTSELIKVWEQKWSEKTNGQKWHDCKLNMPLIWVKKKGDDTDRGKLIISFSNNGCSVINVDEIKVFLWEILLEEYEFLDGSPCGIEVQA